MPSRPLPTVPARDVFDAGRLRGARGIVGADLAPRGVRGGRRDARRGSLPCVAALPFPQSLMLGFRATASTTTLTLDPEEIEDARWVGRAELAAPDRRPVRLPNRDSIARFLIEEWLAEAS